MGIRVFYDVHDEHVMNIPLFTFRVDDEWENKVGVIQPLSLASTC
jgi:hypothetical protein